MRLSDLLGAAVTTESGDRLGSVHDVRADLRPRSVRITGLVVGRLGLLERLGVGAPRAGVRVRTADAIPWSAVVSARPGAVVVRDGTKPSAW